MRKINQILPYNNLYNKFLPNNLLQKINQESFDIKSGKMSFVKTPNKILEIN